MALISDRDRQAIKGMLADLPGAVRLVTFTQELACQFCRETEQLVRELGELSDRLAVEVFNFQLDKAEVAKYRVDKIPAIVVEGEKDHGIRFFGIPMGYEFSALLGAIQDVSRGSTGLSAATRTALAGLQQAVHLQVFVTPT